MTSAFGGADGEVVAQGAAVYTSDGAVLLAVGGAGGDGEGGGAGTVCDGGKVAACDAAVEAGRGSGGVDADVAGHVAVGDGAAGFVVAYDASGVAVAGDAGVGEAEVVDVGTVCLAEDALVPVSVGAAAAVDADATDGVACAVEVAFEVAAVRAVVVADGLEVVLGAGGIVPRRGGGVDDVGSQHEVPAAVVVATVHVGGPLVEVGGARNLVGVSRGAAATAESTVCPRRRGGEHGEE